MSAAQVGAGRNGRPESAGETLARSGEGSPLRLICYAGAALTLAAAIVLAAAPAFASGPVIYVTPSAATPGGLPTHITPGTYMPSIDCSNGSSGTATVVV